jgi:hypothetical protein
MVTVQVSQEEAFRRRKKLKRTFLPFLKGLIEILVQYNEVLKVLHKRLSSFKWTRIKSIRNYFLCSDGNRSGIKSVTK